MLSLLILTAAASFSGTDEAVFSAQAANSIKQKFHDFILRHGKRYTPEEKAVRFAHFIENMIRLGRHAAADPSATYSHLSPFMDWSEAEFKARNNLQAEDMDSFMSGLQSVHDELKTTDLPSSLDWRQKGAVQEIKNQAQCGSCWAFSSVSNIESAAVVQGGQPLRSLSEEQLVDCSESDNGCNGGLQARAFMDMIKGDWGLELESSYPYTAGQGQAGTCKNDAGNQVQKISNFKSVSKNPIFAKFTGGTSDETIMAALNQYGPLAIALDATAMQMYSGGIAKSPKCTKQINHAVNLVGYGTEDGTDYWIIRNSWGTVWGEQGYWRVERGSDNCAINDYVVTATIDKTDILV